MTIKETGGPAFPIIHPPVEGMTAGGVEYYGLTIRDYFAAKALAALIIGDGGDLPHKTGASDAYRYADAMIEARK